MLRRFTPDFCDDERINSLWLWCVENYSKYDPQRGNLRQWVSGVARRVIDIYRKEKGGKCRYEVSFAEWTDDSGKTLNAQDLVEQPSPYGTYDSGYGDQVHALEKQEEFNQLIGVINDVFNKDQHKTILLNYSHQYSDMGLSEEMGLRLNTLQSRRTQYKTKVLDEIQKKNVKRR
jgi:DNA-directed RNA polymerase specialized sigma24 family protein